jgi:hypothetical protein
MTRRTLALLMALVALMSATLISTLPARASRAHTIEPAQIDPNSLALPASSLPAGAQVVHSAVSDNPDAQGTTTPADGDASVFGLAHGGPASYASEGRITGYRMDIHYSVSGVAVRTAYLASIYPSAAQALTAYNDVTGTLALIHIIGAQPLPDTCTFGDKCDAEYFTSPLDTTRLAASVVLVRGPIVIETASDAPAAQITAVNEITWESEIYALMHNADQQVQSILANNPPPPPGSTATPTATTAPATNTPTATSVPATETPTATATSVPLFVTVSIAHKRVKTGKKQSITVTTLPDASVNIGLQFATGKKKHHAGTAASDGTFVWRFKQPGGVVKGKNHTAHITVTVSLDGATHKASKKYLIP